MNTKQQINLIRAAFDRLHVLNNITWSNYQDQLLKTCAEEERSHRGSGPDFAKNHPGAISVADAARLFAVKRIAEYMSGEPVPEIKYFLSMQRSVFFAASLVANYRERIASAWEGLDVKALSELNYVEFVRVKEAA